MTIKRCKKKIKILIKKKKTKQNKQIHNRNNNKMKKTIQYQIDKRCIKSMKVYNENVQEE